MSRTTTDGRVVQRLSVSTKVSIGLPPNGDRNHPTKLDHFAFLRKKKTANRVEWEADPELTRHYGEQCRELHIMLIDDDIENVFPSSYAWWTATERKCWGDGVTATRRTGEKPVGQPWTTCGNGCPELASGQCKPSGDLRFVLADFPRLGSVRRIHTCSYRSIRQIHSADTTPGNARSNSPGETQPPGDGSVVSGSNRSVKPHASGSPSSPAPNNGNGSAGSSGFNQLRNEFLAAARRVATTKKQAIGEVVEWASGGVFKYGDLGRMTESDVPKLQAATDLVTSALAGAAR